MWRRKSVTGSSLFNPIFQGLANIPNAGGTETIPVTGGTPGAIAHDQQTEGYLIISGSGTLVTGGHIVNGRRSGPESEVTKVLNGPSCSGQIAGADVVRRDVKLGRV